MQVRSIAVDPSGQWLASGGDDGALRLWEVRTGRCLRTWALGGKVACVAWCPAPAMRLLSAAVGKAVLLLPSGALHGMAGHGASLYIVASDALLGAPRQSAPRSWVFCARHASGLAGHRQAMLSQTAV